MRPAILLTILAGCAAAPPDAPPPAPFADRVPAIEARFAPYTDGAFVLKDLATGATLRVFPERCVAREAPCSTFKIPNSLIGLEEGVVAGADTLFEWDGTPQTRAVCERDHTLATALRDSVVWYYQRIAATVGAERMAEWLTRLDYGNRDTSAGVTTFWLVRDSLRISADEQVAFLERLYADALPFAPRHQALVRALLVQRTTDGVTLSGKTGSGPPDAEGLRLGWFVGHVAGPEGAYVFATQVRHPTEATGPRHAQPLTEAILAELGLLPPAEG